MSTEGGSLMVTEGRCASPTQVDVHVGQRLRLRRTILGLSTQALGRDMGISSQQIQKYENGTNRIAASRLYDFARTLDVPLTFFFDDMPASITAPSTGAQYEIDVLALEEARSLVHAFLSVTDPEARKRLRRIILRFVEGETD